MLLDKIAKIAKSPSSLQKKIKFVTNTKGMNTVKLMRQEVKKYIDIADVKVVKMMHANVGS